MIPSKNLALLMNSAYVAFNRAQEGGDLAPKQNLDTKTWTTHCNQAIQYVLNCFGYDAMNGKTANEMCDFVNDFTTGWISPTSEQVIQSKANEGIIVLAGRKNPSGHGHWALVLPGILEKSGSYNKSVPKCLNIGKDVFFGKKISEAFRAEEQPNYYFLAQMDI